MKYDIPGYVINNDVRLSLTNSPEARKLGLCRSMLCDETVA